MSTEDEKALLERLDAQLDPTLRCDMRGCTAPASMQLTYVCHTPGAILCGTHALLVKLQIDRETAQGVLWTCPEHGTWPLNFAVRVEVLEGLND